MQFVPRFTYKAAEDMKIGDIVVKAHTYPDGDEHAEAISEDRAEFYGAMLGDGFAKDYGHATCVSMSGIDGPVRSHYKELMSEMTTNAIAEKEREIRVSDKALVQELDDLGITGNAHTKRIPSWIFSQPAPVRRAMLRGLWDTDGSVDKNGRVSFWSCSEMLAKDTHRLCLSLGIQADQVTKSERRTILPNGSPFDSVMYGFLATVAKHNVRVGTRDPKDAERMADNVLRSWKGRRLAGTGSNAYKRFMRERSEHVEYVTITAMELEPVEDVYDIEVQGNHNFVADGIVVHNSNYQEARLSLYQDRILPFADFMFGAWNASWVRRFGDDLMLDFDADQIQAIAADIASAYERYQAASFLTINEKRAAVGYGETDGGDVILINITQIPLDAAGSDGTKAHINALVKMLADLEIQPGDA